MAGETLFQMDKNQLDDIQDVKLTMMQNRRNQGHHSI